MCKAYFYKRSRVVPRGLLASSLMRRGVFLFPELLVILKNKEIGEKNMQLTGAEIICECLLEQGVDTVFGYPGGAALNTYDALYKYSDKITHILTAHEQGAAHAADGYARSTGKVGVVFSTSGPGATNLVTGIATANIDSIPMVAICGNVSRDLLGRDAFQEVNISEVVKPITKASFLVMEMENLAPTIRKAFEIAQSGRKGPVLIDVPKDITAMKCEYTPKEKFVPNNEFKAQDDAIKEAQEILKNAKRPMIYAGGGIISANACDEFVKFAERIDAPVCCSLMALGCMPADHPLFVGNIGMHGGYETGMATDNADVIIACGARFSDRVAGDREKFGQQATIIQLDIDAHEIHKNVKVDNWVIGDLKDSLVKVVDGLEQKNNTAWIEQIMELISWNGSIVAQGGVNISDVLAALNNEVQYIKPKTVSVMIGTNHGATISQYQDIIAWCAARGIELIICNIPMTYGRQSTDVNSAEYIAEELDSLHIQVVRMNNATAIDGNPANGSDLVAFNGDKLHTNQLGNNHMYERFLMDAPQIIYFSR